MSLKSIAILPEGKKSTSTMPRSHSRKEKSRGRYPVSQDDLLDATSARTRPLSYDEIMLRRSKKRDAANQVPSGPEEADIALVHDKIDQNSDFPTHHMPINEDSGPLDVRLTLNDSQKISSQGKRDISAPKKNDKLDLDKREGLQYHGIKLKSIWDKTEGIKRGREGENEIRDQSDRRKDAPLGASLDNRSNKRQARDSAYRKHRTSEGGRFKSEKDRTQLFNDERLIHSKRKTERRVSSNSEKESTRRNERITSRGTEKSEKENRHRRQNEKAKTNIGGTDKKDDLERKGPETIQVSLKESRAKRKRSRSREHEKVRDRRSRSRSRSRSPKVNKHMPHDKRDHGEISSHSTKDRSVREHSEADKNRLSTNASSIHNRRSTGPSSGLGGYSPRKRKTSAAAKTPSPTHRSPERRNAQWDLPPVGKESALASSTSNNLEAPSQNPLLNFKEFTNVTPAVLTTAKPIVMPHQTISSKLHATESVQLTQATRPMRRLYVENLPPSTSQKDLTECINKSLMSYGINYIQASQPCISCIIHKEKSQALLEFLTPEDASSALSLDGMSFAGSSLKLRRPKDFTSVTTGISDKSVAADSISDIVEDSPHKIFIGGISKLISYNMFLEIARAFGPLKAFRYEFVSDLNEPCAFLEYVDHSVTSKACAGLNGMKLGGGVVTAVFATPEAVLENVVKLPFYGIPVHAKPLLEEPTSVLKLINVLDPGGLLALSELELEDILEDIKLECSRFGTVKSINVSKQTNSAGITKACVVKNTSASTDAHDIEFVNRSYSTKPLGESTNPVGELNTSKNPAETQNGWENISQSLEDDNRSVDTCKLPSSNENMSIKNEELANEQNALVTEPESNDDLGNKLSIEGDLQSEDCNPKTMSSGEHLELEENNVLEEGCDEKDLISINIENVGTKHKPLVEDNSLSGKPNANIESSGEELKIEKNILPDEDRKKDIISIDLESVFEVGSIFVEYRRREAACVAAHSLHGRIFDGRVVTVGYVCHDHYHVRFQK